MRLQKFLSDIGYCSRSQAEDLIRAGKVRVNGKKATLGDKVTDQDTMTVDGETLKITQPPAKKVVIFHKPQGVECTLSPMAGVKTLLDVDFGPDRLFPIGRLDLDAHGLLLLTNDGELGNRLAHPDAQHEEEYLIVVKENLTPATVARFAQGLHRGERKIMPQRVEQLADNVLRCVLHEGRSKHLRRMCDAAAVEIIDLLRIRIGTLDLDNLEPGQWRELKDTEFQALKQGGSVRPVRRRVAPPRRK
jgi:pseudouridine synthase